MEFKNHDKVLIQPKMEWISPSKITEICPLVGYLKNQEFVKMNDIIYHQKRKLAHFLLNELIGEIISKYFELQTKKSIIVTTEKDCNNRRSIFPVMQDFTLIAKAFFEDGLSYCEFDDFAKVILPDNKLNNLNRLKSFYDCNGKEVVVNSSSYEKLLLDLKKMIVRDFLTKQSDRNLQNFMFGYKNDNIKLMPLYDYEHSFANSDFFYKNTFDFDLNSKRILRVFKNDFQFQELLYKLMDFDFDLVLEKLEAEYGIILSSKEQSDYVKIIENQQRLVREKKILK